MRSPETMAGVTNLEELRRPAFAVAYRMLGTVSEAEDIVQEALLRTHLRLRQGERIESPRAFVSTVVTRLCIDHLRSARVRRETYVGEWLPEPLVDEGHSDPAGRAEAADSLSLAFLLLLERLTPEQRAAFLLRDAFDYPYQEIAAIIGTGEENARQLVSRARKHVDDGRPRFEASPERREQLANSFVAALQGGDLVTLEELLAHDVMIHADSGGRVRAIARPVYGRDRVARMLLKFVRAAEPFGGWLFRQVQVNGQPGVLRFDAAGKLSGVLALDITDDGRISALRAIVNPDKLHHLAQDST
jgi:RNA polymerase sigma-70 factor (ECF subfamily)